MTVRRSEIPLAELPGSTPDGLLNAVTPDLPSYTITQGSHSYSTTRMDSSTTNQVLFSHLNNQTRDGHRSAQSDPTHKSVSELESSRQEIVNDHSDRKSTHDSSSLNAVVDRIIERTQSIASSTASIRMPILAKHYLPRPVHVQKSYLRHHPLPSKLPPYQSQPSLEDDLRDWMIQTAARGNQSEMELIRLSTVSSTTSPIASRHEIMRTPVSIPNIDGDEEETNTTVPITQADAICQDDTSNCFLPPSVPNSPSTVPDYVLAQDGDTVLSRLPMPPSESGGSPVASEHARPQSQVQFIPLSQAGIVPTSQRLLCRTAVSEATQNAAILSCSRSIDDITLAAGLPLQPLQPNRPHVPSEILHQVNTIVVPHHSSPLARKPLPAPMNGSVPMTPPLATSPKSHQGEHLTADGAIAEPQIHVQDTGEESEPPKPPERQPPPPPAARTSSLSPVVTEPVIPSRASRSHHAAIETSAYSKSPPTVPFIDASSQMSTALEVQRPPPPVPVIPVTNLDANMEAPRPSTAEAKRRAAHARRMKLAFGE